MATDYEAVALAIVERYCDRVLTVADHEYKCLGHGGDTLCLPQWPIITVTSVMVDGTDVTDYEILHDMSLYRSAGWPVGTIIVVQYTAGYETLPPDLQYVIDQLAASLEAQATSLMINSAIASERLGDYSYTLASAELIERAMLLPFVRLLDPYRRRHI